MVEIVILHIEFNLPMQHLIPCPCEIPVLDHTTETEFSHNLPISATFGGTLLTHSSNIGIDQVLRYRVRGVLAGLVLK